MTKLTEAADYVRKRSAAYGGIPHYLKAVGELENAFLAFVRSQTVENLETLNGIYARVNRFKLAAEGHAGDGPSEVA